MGDNTFVYAELGLLNDEIRTISILPGDDVSPLRCSLRHQSIGRHSCLSYSWGSESAANNVYINGKSFAIGANLYNFLHTARRYGWTKRPIWVDAICIDQENDAEKVEQIRRMGEIFNKADSVVVWLGISDMTAASWYRVQEAIQATKYVEREQEMTWDHRWVITKLRNWPDVTFDRIVEQALWLLELNLEYTTLQQGLTQDEDIVRSALLDEALVDIHMVDYWHRAWIVQEVELARNVLLLTPEGSMNFMTIYPFVKAHQEWFCRKSKLEPWHRPHFTYHPQQTYKSDMVRSVSPFPGKSKTLGEALALTKYRQCRHFHDRVYSILALVENGEKFTIDLKLSREELLWECANFALQNEVFNWPAKTTNSFLTQAICAALVTFTMTIRNAYDCMEIEMLAGRQMLPDLSKLRAQLSNGSRRMHWVNDPALRGLKKRRGSDGLTGDGVCLVAEIGGQQLMFIWPLNTDVPLDEYKATTDGLLTIETDYMHVLPVQRSELKGYWRNAGVVFHAHWLTGSATEKSIERLLKLLVPGYVPYESTDNSKRNGKERKAKHRAV